MPKSKKALADEAYLKTETLRGQIDAFDGVQGASTDHPIIHDEGQSAPPVCPHCQARMDIRAGGSWTHLKVWREGETRLQCNLCGGIVTVQAAVWEAVRDEAIRTFTDRPVGKAKYHDKRKPDRGAR